MLARKSKPLDRNQLLHALRINSRVVQRDPPAERMPHQPNREIVDHIEQRGKIEHMLCDGIFRARRPRAVPVPPQIQRKYVIVAAQLLRDPIPIARVIQRAVHQHQRRLSVLTVIPELKLQPVRVKEMRNRFHCRNRPFTQAPGAPNHATIKIYTLLFARRSTNANRRTEATLPPSWRPEKQKRQDTANRVLPPMERTTET